MKQKLVYAVWVLAVIAWAAVIALGVGQFAQTKNSAEGAKRNTDRIIKDNATQTRILCQVIVRNTQNLTDDDIKFIEKTCNKQINQATSSVPDTSNTISVSAPQPQLKVLVSQPQSAPAPVNKQPTDNDGFIINPPDKIPLLPNIIHIPSFL